jgi:hypothetical protein
MNECNEDELPGYEDAGDMPYSNLDRHIVVSFSDIYTRMILFI